MKKKLVVLTGAGISAESGIRTFRDNNGLWEQYPVEDVASIEGWHRNPELMTRFYNERRLQLPTVHPNEAHRLLTQLEEQYDVTIITQNVDNLHERAGSTHIIHLHGELMKVTSSLHPNDPSQIRTLSPDQLEVKMGDKAADGSQLRPFIVWFGEAVPQIEAAVNATLQADLYLVVGTSLNVYPAAGLVNYVPNDAPIYLIDPAPVSWNSMHQMTHIQKGASEGMRELMKTLLPAAS
ncbi:MAG: NAD-dependent protein deacylase [Bacteroidales bacterium]|nr:NAD-dependent protein deacylase [Candidatus Physcousia equi]